MLGNYPSPARVTEPCIYYWGRYKHNGDWEVHKHGMEHRWAWVTVRQNY